MRRLVAALASVFALIFVTPSQARAADIALAWDAVSDPDLNGYIIEYGTAAAPYSTRVFVGNQTTWTFTGLVDGTTYSFRVRAYNTVGTESDPSNEVSATAGTVPSSTTTTATTTTTTPATAPAPASSCTTPDPFVAMGGGTCYNGGWLPPGMAVPDGTTAPTPPPAPANTVTTTGCTTPDPFAAMGGGTCYNGGWLPPGMAVPGGSTAPAPSAPTYPTSTPTTPAGCTTPDPFAAMGGGTCYNGGWLPPGMSLPAGASPSPVAPSEPAPTSSDPATCTTPDPFASMANLVGLCVNGGWIPVSGQDGTARLSDTGTWEIIGDDGVTYEPLAPLDASLDGVRVFFAGVIEGTVGGQTVIQILKISAL